MAITTAHTNNLTSPLPRSGIKHGRLSRLGATGDKDVEPTRHRGIEERAAAVNVPQVQHEILEMRRANDELAND